MPRRRGKKEKDVASLTKEMCKLSLTNKKDYNNIRESIENNFPDINLLKRYVDEFMKTDKISNKVSRCLLAAIIVEIVGDLVFKRKSLKFHFVAPILGFGEQGILYGSLAASAQGYYGDVEAGSVIAKLTSKAMKEKYKIILK